MQDTSHLPKKSLGQHWLYDEATLQSICDSASVNTGDVVLEIGSGLGTLTKRLLQRKAIVTAIEYDAVLAESLSKTIWEDRPPKQDLTVVQEDIMRFDFTTLPKGYKIVANIPYYLTSNLLRLLCESPNPFSTAALLIQKEVAERVVGGPGQMSLLSVSVQFYCETSLGAAVPKELFTPPPKVDSQVLVLHYRSEPLFAGVDVKQFFRIVKAGFSQKRKTLLNALSGGLAINKDEAGSLLTAAGIDPKRRAQTLSLEEWYALYKISLGSKVPS